MSKPAIITAEMAINTLTEVVEGKETFNYHTTEYYKAHQFCVYFTGNGRPSCLIGHALYNLGWRKKDFTYRQNTEEVGQLISFISMEYEALRIFEVAQNSQDGGESWGEALSAARNVYEEQV